MCYFQPSPLLLWAQWSWGHLPEDHQTSKLLTKTTAHSVPVLPHLSSLHLGCGFSAPPCPGPHYTSLPVFSGHHQGVENCPDLFPGSSHLRAQRSLPLSPVNLLRMQSKPTRNTIKGVNGGWEDIQPHSVGVEATCQVPVLSWNLMFLGASQWTSTHMYGRGLGQKCSTTVEMESARVWWKWNDTGKGWKKDDVGIDWIYVNVDIHTCWQR